MTLQGNLEPRAFAHYQMSKTVVVGVPGVPTRLQDIVSVAKGPRCHQALAVKLKLMNPSVLCRVFYLKKCNILQHDRHVLELHLCNHIAT